jgi:hypothetical protein
MRIENLEMGLFFLTSRGSGVRIPQLPHQVPIISGLFSFPWGWGFSRNPTRSTQIKSPEKFGAFFVFIYFQIIKKNLIELS